MTWRDGSERPAVLAVIPARGGSKGIPGKNMKRLGGLTLVGRATQLAVSLDWIDQVIVSTDDPGIAAEVVRQGGQAPFLRPDHLASDTASSDDMWRHAWRAAEDHYGRQFDVSLLLEPTSPLRQAADLTAAMEALFTGTHSAAVTVSPTPAHYAPHKTLTVGSEGRVGFLVEDGARFARRQEVPALYHRNGLCYALRRSSISMIRLNWSSRNGCSCARRKPYRNWPWPIRPEALSGFQPAGASAVIGIFTRT